MLARLFRTPVTTPPDVEAEVLSLCRSRQIEALNTLRDAANRPSAFCGCSPDVFQPSNRIW